MPHPGDYLRLLALQHNRYAKTGVKQLYPIHRSKHREAAKLRIQRSMAQMKKQIKTPEKELSKMKIANP